MPRLAQTHAILAQIHSFAAKAFPNPRQIATKARMDLDSLLVHYFATADLDDLTPETLARGIEQLRLDFGLEQEPARKFALYVLMETLGAAPPPADAFAKPEEAQLRRAAQDWLTATYRLTRDEQ